MVSGVLFVISVYKQKQSLLFHIGGKHGKINDILKQKGVGCSAVSCQCNQLFGDAEEAHTEEERED